MSGPSTEDAPCVDIGAEKPRSGTGIAFAEPLPDSQDDENGCGYIRLTHLMGAAVARTVELRPGMYLDVDDRGWAIGIEYTVGRERALRELAGFADQLLEANATIGRAMDALGVDHPAWLVLDDYDGSMDNVKALVAGTERRVRAEIIADFREEIRELRELVATADATADEYHADRDRQRTRAESAEHRYDVMRREAEHLGHNLLAAVYAWLEGASDRMDLDDGRRIVNALCDDFLARNIEGWLSPLGTLPASTGQTFVEVSKGAGSIGHPVPPIGQFGPPGDHSGRPIDPTQQGVTVRLPGGSSNVPEEHP